MPFSGRWDGAGVDGQRFILSVVVDWLLELSAVRPRFLWLEDDPPILYLDTNGLFGALARDLSFAAAKVSGFRICAGCGEAFTRDRKPVAGKRSWCSEYKAAGKHIRQAKRDQRERERTGRG